MSLFERLAGIVGSFFQIGGPGGPALKNNSGAVEARNAADNAFAVFRVATPVGDNDAATKQYVDTSSFVFSVSLQFNGGSSLPANTSTEQFYVVTTTGVNANIGDLIWDDGSNVGTAIVLAARIGRLIGTTTAFVGGTISLLAQTLYQWSGSAWVAVTAVPGGGVNEIRFAINNTASQTSATSIPANAYVLSSEVEITTPYSPGATIKVGQSGTTDLLQATADVVATVADTYSAPQDTAWGASALPVLVTVAGSPAAGAGFVVVRYVTPNL